MKYFFTFLFTFSLSLSFGQIKINGSVVNEQEQAIEFANILLSSKNDSAKSIGTSTDKNGRFEFSGSEKGNYKIVVSFIGYEDWEKDIELREDLNLGSIILSLSANDLTEVTVTAERGIIEKQDDKIVFNVSRSPVKSGFDGMEVLQRAPNVFVTPEGGILMRNEAATVMINGRISNLRGDNLNAFLSNLQSDEIQSIQIQSSLSANVDGENTGGVINIILKKKPIGFDGSLRMDYSQKSLGDYNFNPALSLNYGAKKWNIYGSYNYRNETSEVETFSEIIYYESNNYLENNRVTERSQARSTIRGGFVVDIAKNQTIGLEYFANRYGNETENIGKVLYSNNDQSLDNGSININSTFKSTLDNSTFNHRWNLDTLGSTWKTFVDYTKQTTLFDLDNISAYQEGFLAGVHETALTDNRTKIFSVQSDLEKRLPASIKFKTGIKYTDTNRDNDLKSNLIDNNISTPIEQRTNFFNYQERISAAYVSLSKKWTNNYFLEVGLRSEYTDLERNEEEIENNIEQSYLDWLPSIYLSKDIDKNQNLSVSYARRLYRPSFRDLTNYVFKVNDFQYELGNPDLRPEYLNRFEVSYRIKKQTIAAYYNKSVDAINGIYFLEDEITFYKRFNSGSQTQYGLEYNRSGNINSWWFMKLSASIYHRKFTNPEGIDSFERTSGYFNLSNNFKINPTTSFDLSGNYRSTYEDAFYVERERYRVNIMLQKSFFNKKLNCRIHLYDLFNTYRYRNERPFETFKTTRLFIPQSRTVRFWMSYNFSNKSQLNKRNNQSRNDARRRL